jgi:anti-anti-sigma factor
MGAVSPNQPESGLLNFDVVRSAGGTVVVLDGEIDIKCRPMFRQLLAEVITQAPTAVSVDLRGVRFMDSTGVHCLVTARELAERNEVPFGLLAMSEPVRRTLDLCGVLKEFAIAPES